MAKGGEKAKKKPGPAGAKKRSRKISLTVRQIKKHPRKKQALPDNRPTEEQDQAEREQAIRREIARIKGESGQAGFPPAASPAENRVRSLGAESAAVRPAAPEQEERAKRMMMWTGVIFFMLLFGGFWVFNLERNFSQPSLGSGEESDWDELTADLSEQLEQMKLDLGELRSFAEKEGATGSAAVLPEAVDASAALSPEEIELLKTKLENLADTASSTED